MSEDVVKPHKITDALNNGFGTWMSRLVLMALAGMAVWTCQRIVGQIDQLSDKVDHQHEETLSRLNGFDVRLVGTERDIVYLKERK